MDFTPSKKPFVENTLREVYILRDELNLEKMKTKQLSETLRKVIDDTKLPKDQFRWYKLLGGNTMKLTRRHRQKRGGQPFTTAWPDSVTQAAETTPIGLPGAIGMPDSGPRLARSDAISRRLDFSDEQIVHIPGCVPISKRLPGHRNDQCEQSEHVDGADRIMCLQPGEGTVIDATKCGPVRPRFGGKNRKTRQTRKTKKSTRRRRRH